jgi:hypothetical protein
MGNRERVRRVNGATYDHQEEATTESCWTSTYFLKRKGRLGNVVVSHTRQRSIFGKEYMLITSVIANVNRLNGIRDANASGDRFVSGSLDTKQAHFAIIVRITVALTLLERVSVAWLAIVSDKGQMANLQVSTLVLGLD